MHESPTLTWREVVDKYHSTFVDELTATLDSAFESERRRCTAEVEHTRIGTAESLNQILRRIRQAPSETAVFEILAEATSSYAARLVVVAIENDQLESGQDEKATAIAVSRRGIHEGDLTFEAAGAAAVAAAIATKDPVTALASAAEISNVLAHAFDEPQGKVYLFPLVARQEVVAILFAAGSVVAATLELLCGAAGLKMETLNQLPVLRPLPSGLQSFGPELIRIGAPAVPQAASSTERRSWKDLSSEDQKLHLQAQRVARVKVAEMRLYHAEPLREGVASGNIYSALRVEIDNARTAFLQSFLSKSPTMVDYLHLELLRSLAHDDDRLLGEDYPGPMV